LAAGLQSAGVGGGGEEKPWTRESVVEAIRKWRADTGAWPTAKDWRSTGPGHPVTATAGRLCGGKWSQALALAKAKR